MRLFIAVGLSDEMKRSLKRAQRELYARGMRGNFTPEENLHLTRACIGEYPDSEPVMDALSTISFEPFELALDGMGCFGELIWAGVADSAALEAVARRVRRALAEGEVPVDKMRFSPHITLLRKASRKLPGVELAPASMLVGAISLLRSERGKNGMIYTELGVLEAQR